MDPCSSSTARRATLADMQALALVGLAHFTTLRIDDGRVKGLGLHLDRLTRDGRALFEAAPDPDLVWARIREAIADAVFTGARGLLAEGPTWNLGFIAGGEVIWPFGAALDGVTRALLASAVDGDHRPVALGDLGGMDAAFTTSVGIGVRPIASIDGTAFSSEHPLLGRLRAAYAEIEGEAL